MTMIKRIIPALGALVFLLSVTHTINAEPLTSQQVERFIASMPEAQTLGEKHNDNTPHGVDPARPMSSSLERMDRKSTAYTDLARLASRHGFANPEQWADVGDRTINAYAAVTSGKSSRELEAAYKAAIANVNSNPALTAAQKKAILAGMGKGHQPNANTGRPSEQDTFAVQPHLAKLSQLFE